MGCSPQGHKESDTAEYTEQDPKNVAHSLPRQELGVSLDKTSWISKPAQSLKTRGPGRRRYEARTQGSAAFPIEGKPPCLGPEPAHPACFGLCSLQRKGGNIFVQTSEFRLHQPDMPASLFKCVFSSSLQLCHCCLHPALHHFLLPLLSPAS